MAYVEAGICIYMEVCVWIRHPLFLVRRRRGAEEGGEGGREGSGECMCL